MTRSQSGFGSGRLEGTQAVVGAVIAVLGVLSAANPGSAVLKALSDVAPTLAHVVPTIVTACGAIIAAFSPPPRIAKR